MQYLCLFGRKECTSMVFRGGLVFGRHVVKPECVFHRLVSCFRFSLPVYLNHRKEVNLFG
nr:MAG TPA: hypothetical protein [Caudoviricetes sp.]